MLCSVAVVVAASSLCFAAAERQSEKGSIAPVEARLRGDSANTRRLMNDTTLNDPLFFINNGFDASPNVYPFFAQMWAGGPDGFGQGCGGSLIADQWVVTAAHCVSNIVDKITTNNGFPEWRVGSFCLDAGNCGGVYQIIRSKRGFIHPWYNGVVPKWDFALIELDERATKNSPVHIDDGTTHDSLVEGDLIHAIGMGYVNNAGVFANKLQYVNNYLLDLDRCSNYYSTGKSFDRSVMCTNGLNFGLCSGDSGSPVLVADSHAPFGYVQVSLTSFGAPFCENHDYPDGSARISSAFDWIVKTVCPTYWHDDLHRPHFCPPPPPTVEAEQPPPPPPPPPPQDDPLQQLPPRDANQDQPPPPDIPQQPSNDEGDAQQDDSKNLNMNADTDSKAMEEPEKVPCEDLMESRASFYDREKEKNKPCKKIKKMRHVERYCNEEASNALIACPYRCACKEFVE